MEGNYVMLTLVKNYIDESKIQKRTNVKKMVLLKDLTVILNGRMINTIRLMTILGN